MRLPSEYLSDAVGAVGRSIATHPSWYIVGTAVLSVFLGTVGLLQASHEIDVDTLFFNFDSQAGKAWEFLEQNFPVNYSAFQPDRVPFVPASAEVIFTARGDTNLLDKAALLEILEIENRVRNITVGFMGRRFGYEDVCARWNGSCYETATTKLLKMIDQVSLRPRAADGDGEDGEGGTPVDWPLFVIDPVGDGRGFEEIFLPEGLGSVVTNDDDTVKSVRVIKSTFYVRIDGEFNAKLTRTWQAEFTRYLETLMDSGELEFTDVLFTEDQRIHWKVAEMPLLIIKNRMIISVVALMAFSAAAFMTGDWVTSKPLLGVVAVVSCGLAVAASYGLLLAAGLKLSLLVGAVPFIALGVGVDDAFVLVAAWHMTDGKLSVPDRLAATYREAAVGITITTLTDIIGFGVGAFMPFKGLADFCIFAAMSMAMTYVYVVLFFGGFIALAGKAEAEGRHCLTHKIIAKAVVDDGSKRERREVDESAQATLASRILTKVEHASAWMRSMYVELLHNSLVRVLVCLSFAAYLAGAFYGTSQLRAVMDWTSLVPRADVYFDFAKSLEANFLEFPPPVQIVLGGDLDYSNATVQERIETMIRTMEDSEFFRDSLFTQSWLRGFLDNVQNGIGANSGNISPIDISTEDSFVRHLEESMLSEEDNVDALDVFIEGGRIKASRFLLLPSAMTSANDFPNIAAYLEGVIKKNFSDLVVYHTNAMYIRIAEPALQLLDVTFTSLTYSAIGICLVTLILATRATCTFFICMTTVTVMAGLLGYSQLLGQDYDGPMMLSVIMSIGFSIDFSAHFALTYTCKNLKGSDSRKKFEHTLKAVGSPILLGAITSLIGVSGLVNSPADAYDVLFRVATAVILLGVYHGLIVLPVFLFLLEDVAGYLGAAFSCCNRDGKAKQQQQVSEVMSMPAGGTRPTTQNQAENGNAAAAADKQMTKL